MNIIKYGHCAMHVDMEGVGFMIDPGGFSNLPEEYPSTDALLLTHEHGDHFQISEVKRLQSQCPEMRIITNNSLATTLRDSGISAITLRDGEKYTIKDREIIGVGSQHAEIFCEFGLVENIGFFISQNKQKNFFFPGDAFTDPQKEIEVLALPIAGPWMALKECIAYISILTPKNILPVHDAVLSPEGREVHMRLLESNISDQCILHDIENAKTYSF